jgi:hypothetical protein
MKATLVLRRRDMLPGGIVIEMVIWQLPVRSTGREHGFKYRLQAHRSGRTLVRYDNETGKGDHRHYGQREEPYQFASMERLIEDFIADVERLSGERLGGVHD